MMKSVLLSLVFLNVMLDPARCARAGEASAIAAPSIPAAYESALDALDIAVGKLGGPMTRNSRMGEWAGRLQRNSREQPDPAFWKSLPRTLTEAEGQSPEWVAFFEKAKAAKAAYEDWEKSRTAADASARDLIKAELLRVWNAPVGEAKLDELERMISEYMTHFPIPPQIAYNAPTAWTKEGLTRDLRALRQLIDAEISGDAEAVWNAHRALVSSEVRFQISDVKTRERVERYWRPLIEKLDAERAEFAKAVVADEPAEKIKDIMERIRQSEAKTLGFRGNSVKGQWIHRCFAFFVAGESKRAFQALRELLSVMDSSCPDMPEAVKDKLRKLERPLAETVEKAEAESLQALAKDLAGVKSAVELSELAIKASQTIAKRTSYETSSIQDSMHEFAAQAYRLAGHWTAGTLPASETSSRGSVAALMWAAPVEVLRQRIYLDVLSKRKGFEELSQDDYKAIPLGDSLARLSVAAGVAGEWKRALEILDVLRGLEPGAQNGAEARQAISSFLKGQQQEASGDVELAVASYRAVVATIADGIPVKEASARLTELRKKKPDAFKVLPPSYQQR